MPLNLVCFQELHIYLLQTVKYKPFKKIMQKHINNAKTVHF